MMQRQPLLTPHWLMRLLSNCWDLIEGYTSLTLLPGDHGGLIEGQCFTGSVPVHQSGALARAPLFISVGSGMC